MFYVRYNGELFAKNATISGEITATGGTIGGCVINKTTGQLEVDSAHITSLDGSKISANSISGDQIKAGTLSVGHISGLTAEIESVVASKIAADYAVIGQLSVMSGRVYSATGFSSGNPAAGIEVHAGGNSMVSYTLTAEDIK